MSRADPAVVSLKGAFLLDRPAVSRADPAGMSLEGSSPFSDCLTHNGTERYHRDASIREGSPPFSDCLTHNGTEPYHRDASIRGGGFAGVGVASREVLTSPEQSVAVTRAVPTTDSTLVT